MNEIILGCDISTKTIGISVFLNDGTENGKILKMTHICPKISDKIKGIESLILKNKIFKEEVIKEYKNYGITRAIVEAPLLRSQNINTVSTLLQFNGMICNTIYEELNIIPELISSYTAREYAFPEFMAIRKFNKKGQLYDFKHYETAIKKNQLVLFGQFPWDIDKKLLLFNKVNEKYPYIEWKINKNGELAQENFDSSDSLICILGQLNFDKYKNNEFKIFEYDLSNKNLISYKTQLNTEIYSKTIEIS